MSRGQVSFGVTLECMVKWVTSPRRSMSRLMSLGEFGPRVVESNLVIKRHVFCECMNLEVRDRDRGPSPRPYSTREVCVNDSLTDTVH